MSGKRGKFRGPVILYYLIAAAVLVLDQATKYCAIRYLAQGKSVPVVEGIFHLTLVYNTGAAFGLFRGRSDLFVIVAVPAAAAMMYFLRPSSRALNAAERTALSMILGGTLGNLADRLMHGHVTDFFDLRVWPVFNVADSFITVGAILLGAAVILGNRGGKV